MSYSPLFTLVCISLVGITTLTGSRFSMYYTYTAGGNHHTHRFSLFDVLYIHRWWESPHSQVLALRCTIHTPLVGITALTGSRFSIYRNNKILLQTVFVNREKGILRNLLKIFWQWRLQCHPLLCHRMYKVKF